MSFDAHKNFAYSTVAAAPSPADTGLSLDVAAGEGALFPAPPFNATVWPAGVMPLDSNAELVRVTGIATDTLTITRQTEGSNSRSILVGDQIAATISAKTLTDVEEMVGGPILFSSAVGAFADPNGNVTGNVNQVYKNEDTGESWYKKTGNGTNTGWV